MIGALLRASLSPSSPAARSAGKGIQRGLARGACPQLPGSPSRPAAQVAGDDRGIEPPMAPQDEGGGLDHDFRALTCITLPVIPGGAQRREGDPERLGERRLSPAAWIPFPTCCAGRRG